MSIEIFFVFCILYKWSGNYDILAAMIIGFIRDRIKIY